MISDFSKAMPDRMQECNNSKVLKENYSKLDNYANLNYLSSVEVEYIF